jgi:NAD(P)H-nitrite reductase large subunit
MNHVILGNGPAGVIGAETIRKADPRSDITLVGDEPEPPYSRMAIPYLLAEHIEEPGTYLRKDKDHFARLRISLINARATRVDMSLKVVELDNGSRLQYDKLLIATGSHAVAPPIAGMQLPGVYPCWTMEDARKIAKLAKSGARVLQMGAGFIGCIILEALAARGVKLTVVEMGDRMVPRMMTQGAGTLIKNWCEAKGVRVHTNTRVESISQAEPGVLHAKLSTGDIIVADLIISATGVKPNIAFLKDSGINMGAGILVDNMMQTNVPGIYAAGDVAETLDFSTGKLAVNAIQPNAADQARVAGLNMAGKHMVSQGSLAINVLATLGLISSSFGMWWGAVGGETAELCDEKNYRYMSLQFKDDVLVGATSLGLTEHVGVLRGLIQSRTRLGEWKEKLLKDPTRIMEAYLAKAQAQAQTKTA